VSDTRHTDEVVIGIDIGGTSIKGVVVGRDGAAYASVDRPTPVDEGVDAVVDAVVDTVERLRSTAGPDASPVGVGLVMPGVVDRSAGMARSSANIGWRDLPIRQIVADRIGLPVAIEHDVRAAGMAEVRYGAARGVSDVLVVSIGTGVAAALVVGGTVVDGAAGLAGEIGHVPVYPDGELCRCGQRGCAEAYSSGAAVSRRYAARTGRPAVPAEEVIARAAGGDRTAAAVLHEAVVGLTRAVLGCVLLTDPRLIVLAGGMAGAGAALTEPLAEGLQRSLLWRTPPPIVVSTLGGGAGARGATLLGWTASERSA
jgi:glucokinase